MKNIIQKSCVIVPVYNEAGVIRQVIKSLEKLGILIICVNDGSTDNSAKQIKETSAILITHPFNMGQGAAIQTGVDYALGFASIQYIATFDGDGQHNVVDLKSLLHFIAKEKVDIVLGSRFLNKTHATIPITKKVLLKTAITISNLERRIKLTDVHNGLRVFNRRFAEMLNLRLSGMAHASEIIDRISQNNYAFAERAVTINYNDYSKTKGQPLLNSVNIVAELFLNRISSK